MRLRDLPSVDELLRDERLAAEPRELALAAARNALERAREEIGAGGDPGSLVAAVLEELARMRRHSLRRVLNATGVLVHTNLGRAPLADAALARVVEVGAGYSNLEYDLERGARGSRYTHCVSLLTELTGAEDALVVNNGASALVLALNTLAEGREAIVSRGELIEIGGSFRIPDIMDKSGARLAEVGTTNRTHLSDYAGAISARTGALVKVHRSNFALEGFTAEVAVRELASLGAERGVPVLFDLGSGLLVSLEQHGLRGEPVASDVLRDGATAVTMSGDKLLGGPQAGIVVGRGEAIARMRKNPLTRALRVDKLTLAALEATLSLYREPARALREIPTLALLTAPAERLRERAESLRAELSRAGVAAEVVPSEGSVGGGAFPTARLPSFALALAGDARALDARLRSAPLPVVGRIAEGRLLLDLRSLPQRDDARFSEALRGALS